MDTLACAESNKRNRLELKIFINSFQVTSPKSSPNPDFFPEPGTSLVHPPLTRTMFCSCKLCPSPGMDAALFIPCDILTFSIARIGIASIIHQSESRTNEISAVPDSQIEHLFKLHCAEVALDLPNDAEPFPYQKVLKESNKGK
ncbi:hypothetical protein BpHYR1_035304 [Brachionus plicatilis]|uniref:Uncharacterized protein n=1 Tax=Brachionus plicatilis TaxID=10195 RepID=A0A3M7QNJ9_BRAPC|nr:hypothetical protein BpHYR1_035304 [Brachionus plicatilis]